MDCTYHGKLVDGGEPQAKFDLDDLFGRPRIFAGHGLSHPLYTIRLGSLAWSPLAKLGRDRKPFWLQAESLPECDSSSDLRRLESDVPQEF